MAKAIDVATEMVKFANSNGYDLTHMQLQKLVYIAHGIKLAEYGVPLVEEGIGAWKYGPVISELYQSLKKFGSGIVKINPEFVSAGLPDVDMRVIKETVNKFHKYDGIQLSELTHQEGSPWHKAWFDLGGSQNADAEIPDNIIKSHYLSIIESRRADCL